MKSLFSVLFIMSITTGVFSQPFKDTTIKIDLLESPSSAAFSLLNIASSSVERPTDAMGFAIALQNESDNFTTIPRSFGLQFAPMLLGKYSPSLKEYGRQNFRDVFKQTFSISTGFQHSNGKEDDTLKYTNVSAGLNFSIIRPKWSAVTDKKYNEILKSLQDLIDEYEAKKVISEPEHKLDSLSKVLAKKLNKTEDEIQQLFLYQEKLDKLRSTHNEASNVAIKNTDVYALLQKMSGDFKIQRKGGFLDFAGGFANQFKDNVFNRSKIYKGGAWLTGGYIQDATDSNRVGLSVLAIARYLYNPDVIFSDDNGILKADNISTLDGGARILVNGMKGKLNVGAEAIYRSILNKSVFKPTWRFGFTTDYAIWSNTKLAFSFGKDFDNTYVKGGNVFSALNFIFGVGNNKPLSKKYNGN